MVVILRPPRITHDHPVQWRTASPLWHMAALTDSAALVRPAILRFTTDSFMEDFLKVVTQAPHRLGEWKVRGETWRSPAPVPPLPPPAQLPSQLEEKTTTNAKSDKPPFKLFQPAHQRYYLVIANLVCRIPGFPDRMLRTNNDEQVSFILRRQMQDAADDNLKEHAFVDGCWQPTGDSEKLLPGEEKFPMFPVNYNEADGYRRRIFAGLIPVGERERFLNAPRKSAQGDALSPNNRFDQLMTLFNMDVAAPWRELLRQVGDDPQKGELGPTTQTIKKSLEDAKRPTDRKKVIEIAINQRDQLQFSSWYGLLDFACFLKIYLPRIWEVIDNRANSNSLPSAQHALYNALKKIQFRPGETEFTNLDDNDKYYELLVGKEARGTPIDLTQALSDAEDSRNFLETTSLSYDTTRKMSPKEDWPKSVFLLCGRGMKSQLDQLDDKRHPITYKFTQPGLIRQALQEEPARASQTIPQTPLAQIPQTPLAQAISSSAKESDVAHDEFQIRCVFERPKCPPSVHPTVVSNPTQKFQLASYFDPDAPARPIRIPMPVDTTLAGLKKFAKNTMFVMSDSLACQVEKARSLTFADWVLSVLPWPFHKPLDTSGASCDKAGVSIGKIFTFSIPIITICALMVMLIFVTLLDAIFKWVPYLFFWLPLPGVTAKPSKTKPSKKEES